jgi:hypothetical protein
MSTNKKSDSKSVTKAPAPIAQPPAQPLTEKQIKAQQELIKKEEGEAALKASTAGSSERPTEEANLPHDSEILKNYNQTGVEETDTGFGKLDADEGQPQQQ